MSTPKTTRIGTGREILDRLQDALAELRDISVHAAMGIPSSTVRGWRARNSVPLREILDVAEREGIAIEWLLKGRGRKFRPDNLTYTPIAADELVEDFDIEAEFVLVPVYGVELAAGAGRIPEDEQVVRYHAYHRFYFNKWGLEPQHCCVVRISGDSMNDLLFDGDHGLVHMAERNVISGKAYAFRMGEELLVKYLQRLPNGNLQASSHNHAQYPPFEIRKEDLGQDVEIIGRLRDHNHRWD